MSDNETVPTQGVDYGHTIVGWPVRPKWGQPDAGASIGINPDFDPVTGNGWLPEEDGYNHDLPAGTPADVQSAINQVKQAGGLMSVDLRKLRPAAGYPWDPTVAWDPVFVYFPAKVVSDSDLSAGSLPETVPVHSRIQDDVHDGAQFISITGSGSQLYNLPVIKATPTPRGPYYTIGHLPGPMGPYTFTFNANAPHSEMHFARDEEKVSALHPAGFTVGANTTDCIVVFPEGSGLEPLYFSMTVILPEGPLKQRQEEENQARAKADAEAKAKAEAEAKAKAEAEAKAKAEREALFARAGVVPAPTYTPEMVKSAEAALGAAGVMVLGQTPGAMQLSVAGGGVLTATGEILSSLGAAVGRVIASLGATATAGTAGPMVAAASAILFSPAAGGGSDRVPGRDLNAMFALNAQLLAGPDVKIEPGATSVNLPERGHLVNSNGQMALQLLKTGDTLPAAVPVLNAVRDAATGLDRITVPAVAGAPERTILVNPAPPPAAPSDTASPPPSVPVTPVHTGTEIKPVETITVTTTPAADIGGLQDFIYWRPDAAGTGVEPVYVMLSGLYGETNAKGKYSGRDYNSDKAGGPIQDLDWKTATIDREGVDKVKLHTGRFGELPDNKVMIDRLENILNGGLQATDTDLRFYTHEIRELERYRNLGVKDGVIPDNYDEVWNNTHTATLEDYKINEKTQPLYTPEAEEAYRKAEEGK
ncbi:S-type pyocin domain-containing protein [Salmonella enterica subsp. enterica serovar Rubislaw]|nr:S-type pyocin domain-containing protein [Salmonella enterica]EKF0287435.1 S-type pyocin domain-containing protein [Salmonella enterica subsp. enterica]ELI4048047.1 S-type pyocin domain-containing protein [Salmonella enterica subsp. enterica serovar Rubislaw]ELJ3614796.1 S-type pyocin domain-containing protein [Salmonella enterica subsp. enterica]ELQ2702024.1 S-type pyocin domain-containing protein [Salmonella enterica]